MKKIYLLMCLVVSSGMCMKMNAVAVDPGTANLTHQWTFDDGTPKDVVGTLDGTLTGGATVAGRALKLTAEGQYLAFSPTALALNTYSELSIEAWVSTTSTQMLFYFGNGTGLSGSVGSQGYFATTGNASRTAISCINLTAPWSSEDNVNGSVLNNGVLHHLVSIISATNITFYCDGVFKGTKVLAAGNSIAQIGQNLATIGRSGYPDPTWQGTVNKFSIYNKALTADEVLYLYNVGAELVPQINTSVSNIVFTPQSKTVTFTVSPKYLTQNVIITAPAGMVVTPSTVDYTLLSTNVTVDYSTYAAISTDTIRLTSGTAVTKIPVIASAIETSCIDPLNANPNLIFDPSFNLPTLEIGQFSGWGNHSINTDPAISYCGNNCGQIVGTAACSGSLDANITLEPNTTYVARAMVKTIDGTFELSVGKSNGTAADINNSFDTGGVWQPVSFEFTSGEVVAGAGCYFNSCNGSTGKNGYIDNWEIRKKDISSGLTQIPSEKQISVYNNGKQFVVNFNLGQTSNVQFSVFNMQGMKLVKVISEFGAGKNTKMIDNSLPSGVYFVQVSINGKFETIKVVK